MFWRAARGRVGPNSRAGLHMAIFLLNPYGLYAYILIPKWLASSPEMSGFASYLPAVGSLPPGGSHMPIGPRFSIGLSTWHVVFRASYGPPPYIFGTRFVRAKPRAMYANRSYIKREKQWVQPLDFYRKI